MSSCLKVIKILVIQIQNTERSDIEVKLVYGLKLKHVAYMQRWALEG